jgi:lipopolysaccharide transport system permease protein
MPFPSISPRSGSLQEIVITAQSPLGAGGWREIVQHRHLLANLIRREAKLPYLNLSFGVVWALIRALTFAFVFFFIRNSANADMRTGIEYPLYVYTGVTLWWYFVDATTAATASIFKDAGLITKVYYPRAISPAAPVVARLTELALQATMYPVGMLVFGHYPDWRLVLLPLVVLQVMILALGAGMLVAALAVRSQDYMAIQRYLLYIGMFLSPVIFAPALLSPVAQSVYYVVNPMAAPLQMFRASLFRGADAPWVAWACSVMITLVLFRVSYRLFRRQEAELADAVL